MIGQSHFQEAAEVLRPLLSMNCDPRVNLLSAAVFEANGERGHAEETLQHAHAIWPANNSIAASLAREYLSARQTDKAVQALAHFHATAATPLQEMELAILVYFSGHELVSARAVAEVAYKSQPSLHTLLLLANALQLQGRYPEVNALLGDERAKYGDSPEFLITLAESESDAAIYATARQDLTRAIALDPQSHQAHYLLGYVLAQLHDPEGAIAEYRKSIELAPDQPRTYFQLALALRIKQDEAGEERALEQALVADEHYAPAHCEIGRIFLEQHRFNDAVSHLNAAIEYNPSSEEAYYLLARAYTGLGEKDKSAEAVNRLIAVRKANRPGPKEPGQSHPENH